jgi:hypothetical protein
VWQPFSQLTPNKESFVVISVKWHKAKLAWPTMHVCGIVSTDTRGETLEGDIGSCRKPLYRTIAHECVSLRPETRAQTLTTRSCATPVAQKLRGSSGRRRYFALCQRGDCARTGRDRMPRRMYSPWRASRWGRWLATVAAQFRPARL